MASRVQNPMKLGLGSENLFESETSRDNDKWLMCFHFCCSAVYNEANISSVSYLDLYSTSMYVISLSIACCKVLLVARSWRLMAAKLRTESTSLVDNWRCCSSESVLARSNAIYMTWSAIMSVAGFSICCTS